MTRLRGSLYRNESEEDVDLGALEAIPVTSSAMLEREMKDVSLLCLPQVHRALSNREKNEC